MKAPQTLVGENAIIAALRAEIARLTAERDAAPSGLVKVKPLVWEGEGHWCSGDNEGWLEEANTPFGWGYAIEFGNFDNGPWVASSTFGETLTGFDSPDAAKAAARADYEARIIAALEPQPITVQDAARVLLEAMERSQIDMFDAIDPEIKALAVKCAGNRGDAVMQLEIAEAFFKCALRAIAKPGGR